MLRLQNKIMVSLEYGTHSLEDYKGLSVGDYSIKSVSVELLEKMKILSFKISKNGSLYGFINIHDKNLINHLI